MILVLIPFHFGLSGCVCCTCSVGAALAVERALPEDDLLGDDGKAVDVSFLRGALLPQVLRGNPQV